MKVEALITSKVRAGGFVDHAGPGTPWRVPKHGSKWLLISSLDASKSLDRKWVGHHQNINLYMVVWGSGLMQ